MNIADVIRKLDELHRSGALSDEEFASAREAVLTGADDGPAKRDPGQITQTPRLAIPRPGRRTPLSPEELAKRGDELNRRRALIELDKEWDREREVLLRGSLLSQGAVPSRARAVTFCAIGVTLIVGAVAGVGYQLGNVRATLPGLLACGAFFLLLCVWASTYEYRRAILFEAAKGRYDRKRADLGDHSPPWPDEVDSFTA